MLDEYAATPDDLAPITVLHVDDDPDFVELAATFLERAADHLIVETATSAGAGLDRLGTAGIDCVVSDYEMPRTDGIEFLEAVSEEHPNLPFILFTGKGSETVANEAISAGVTDYLQKGVATEQYELLANRIGNAVDAHRSRQLPGERTRRLETLISNLPGVVYRCRNDPGWPMETVEGEVKRLTGYSGEQLERGDVSWGEDILHPDDVDPVWESVQGSLADDDTFEATYRIVTADGATKWLWERGRVVDSPPEGSDVLEGFITDITDREERKRELERRTAELAELTTELEEQYRYLFEEAPVMAIVTRAEDGRPVIDDCNHRVVETLLRAVPRCDARDEIVGTLALYIDVSERKELERQNERLAEFASIVSHDLRSPLNVARSRAKLARSESDLSHLDDVIRAHDRMAALIDDLLTLARAGERIAETEPVGLATLVDRCWADVRSADATLRVETDRTVRADRSRLRQLLENLVRNAVEHAGSDVLVTVGDVADGFYVADDGPGVPPEDRDDVFEAGYSTADDGTGFGLRIVEQVADAHGWRVEVTESADGGARFEVRAVEFEA
jgi:PAS domain S-box-containing protein